MKLPLSAPRKVDAAASVILVLVGAVLLTILVKPAWQRYQAAVEERRSRDTAEAALRRVSEEHLQVEEEIDLLERALARQGELIPPMGRTFAFLEELGRLARQEKVKLDRIEPGAFIPGANFAALPVELRVRGSFRELVRFLSRIEASAQLVRVERISLTTGRGKADRELEVTIQVFCAARSSGLDEDASL